MSCTASGSTCSRLERSYALIPQPHRLRTPRFERQQDSHYHCWRSLRFSRPFPYAVDAGVTFLPEEVARFFGPWGGPGFAVSMWCCGAMVLCVAERRSTWYSQFLSTRALVFVGTISYSVYLWHYPISIAIYRRGPSILRWNSGDTVNWMGLVLYTIVCAVVSIGVGWISYQLLERRVIRSRASAT
ncbi:MAG: acyltransferase family protein [Microthrixaceae bacterium]